MCIIMYINRTVTYLLVTHSDAQHSSVEAEGGGGGGG